MEDLAQHPFQCPPVPTYISEAEKLHFLDVIAARILDAVLALPSQFSLLLDL